jgi:hypothetical protein
MRHFITAVAAIAVGGFLASTTVRADPRFEPGGPARVGNMCQLSNDDGGNDSYGSFVPCPNQPVGVTKRIKKQNSKVQPD